MNTKLYLQHNCIKKSVIGLNPLCFMKRIAALLLLFAQLAFAQQVTAQCDYRLRGTITDASENAIVPFATITSSVAEANTQSDEQGKFELTHLCDTTYTFTFSKEGYSTYVLSIRVNQDTTLFITLFPERGMFKEVIVSESKQNASETNIQSIISDSELNSARGRTLGETLKSIPGLTTLNTGNNISKPVIHGLHSNRILILNNGIRQEGQQWGNEHAPEIDLFIANKLTVIKGASGLEYGHDAIGGIVLIETQDLLTSTGLRGSMDLVSMTNGRQGVISGSLEGCSKKIPALSARIQGTLHRSGNLNTPDYILKNSGKSEYNYSAAAEYRHEKFKLEFFYSQFNTDIGIFSGSHIGNLTDLQRAIASERPSEISSFTYDIDRPKQHIEHELHKLRLTLFQSTTGKLSFVYARQYNLRQEFDKHLPRNDSLASENKPELNLEITTHSVDVRFEKHHGNGWTLKTGLNSSLQKNTYEGRYFIPNYIQQNGGVYFIEQKKIHNTSLEIGLRYDVRRLEIFRYVNQNLESPEHMYKNAAAQFGMTHVFSELFRLTVNGGTTWRAPQASELYSNGLHHGAASVEIGDDLLTHERAYNASSEFHFTKNKLQFSIQPFAHYINDFIYLSPTLPATLTIRGAFPTFVYRQADVLMYGSDGNFKLRICEKDMLHFKASILRARNQNAHDFLIQMPSDRYEAGITHQFKNIKHLQKSELGIAASYVNRQWRTPANSDYLNAPEAYLLISAHAETQIHINSFEMHLGLRIDNLLNTTYRDYMNRFRYYSDEIGRNIQLHIKIPFNKITQNEN